MSLPVRITVFHIVDNFFIYVVAISCLWNLWTLVLFHCVFPVSGNIAFYLNLWSLVCFHSQNPVIIRSSGGPRCYWWHTFSQDLADLRQCSLLFGFQSSCFSLLMR
jgi:hypothetical protein